MNALDLSPRSEACLSDLVLDRLLTGELDGRPEHDLAIGHLAACARCRTRRDDLAAESARVPSDALLAAVTRGSQRRRQHRGPVLAAVSALAAAAAVVAVMVRPVTRAPDDGAATVRLKGDDFGFEVLVRRADGRAEPVGPDLPLHQGDVIGFRVRTRSRGYLAVVSVDSAGQISRYLPASTATPPMIGVGDSIIDQAITLDAVVGHETLFAALCEEPGDALRAQAAVAAVVRGDKTGPPMRLALPCLQARASITKQTRR